MTTQMPNDGQGRPIPALRLAPGKSQKITAAGTAAKNAVAFSEDTRVIGVYAVEDIYIEVGADDVVATTNSHFLPGGLYYDIALVDDDVSKTRDTHISVLQVSAGDTVYVSEKV